MKRPIVIILRVFALTILAVLIYTVYLAMTVDESATLGIPFAFIGVTGLALFLESIILAFVLYKHVLVIWPLLLRVFLVTSIVPIYFIYSWYSNRPAKVPGPGQLPVSESQYQADTKLVIDDYLKTEMDSNRVDRYYDTILTAQIDTIFYSLEKAKFFAIIIAITKDGDKQKYCTRYRAGRHNGGTWKLNNPKANVWTTCFSSLSIFKNDIRQYYYKRYSINSSSDKPEIWMDSCIFNH